MLQIGPFPRTAHHKNIEVGQQSDNSALSARGTIDFGELTHDLEGYLSSSPNRGLGFREQMGKKDHLVDRAVDTHF